jgi:hypothetical protein
MKKILSFLTCLIFFCNFSIATEKVEIDKQLVGIVGAVTGEVKTNTRDLKTGDKIYLNETILAGIDSGTQILLLDQSTFTIGSDSEVVMDTFVYDPATNDGKIVASVKQGSLKIISGLISKKNPDSLTVKVPEGTLGSRGTEFQTMVSKKQTSTLLIGPGKNNTLGLRPGAVLVGNKLGSTLLNNPYSISTMTKGKAPGQAKKITKSQLKKFKKKMKSLKVAKLKGDSKDEKKEIRKQIKKDLKAAGLNKEEIKVLIKDNIKKDKEKKIAKKKAKAKDKKEKKKKAKIKDKKEKKKKAKIKDKKEKKKKAVKKKSNKKKKAVKKKSTKKKKAVKKKTTKKKKAVKKKTTKKKKAVKKKTTKKKKAVKKVKKKAPKKKKVVKKKPPKKKKVVKKKPPKKKKVVKKKPPKKKINKKKNVQKKKQQNNKKKAKNKRNKGN